MDLVGRDRGGHDIAFVSGLFGMVFGFDLIPLGRVLSFVWSVAASVVLVRMTKDTVPCKSSPRKRGHVFWSVVYEEPRPAECTPWSPWSVQFRGGT